MAQVDWRSEYPFASQFFDLGKKRLHFVTNLEGPWVAGSVEQSNGSGIDQQPVVLCIHGNPTWSFYYRSLLTSLKGICPAIAVDHLGCGLSDKPASYDYCLQNHIDNLIGFVTGLDLQRIVLVVHDWGGAIGLGAAAAMPTRIEKLMILNTAAFPPPYIPLRIAACRIPIVGSFAMLYGNAFAQAATFMAIDRLDRLPKTAKAGLLYPYNSPSNRIGIDRFVRDIPLTQQHRTYPVLERLEKNLTALRGKPTQFVWGAKDWCFRLECLTRLQKHFEHSQTRVLEDVGHYVMEEAPREVFDELRNLLEWNR